MSRGRAFRLARAVAAAAAFCAMRALPAQQDLTQDKTRVADAVLADLRKLSDLERTYFAEHKRYTDDLHVLNFAPASGAQITLSYASARTFSASGSHARLAPFICFIIVSSPAATTSADKPFCTDSRYGTAAAALARGGASPETASVAPRRALPTSLAAPTVTPVTKPIADAAAPEFLTATEFEALLKRVAAAPRDSIAVVVQFAVKDARYDPSRGVLEIALEPVPLPAGEPRSADKGPARAAFECHTTPAFVCGDDMLTYIARDLFRVPPLKAPDVEILHSGLKVQAHFVLDRRDDTQRPSLTLVALVLQAKGAIVSHWEAAPGR